MTRLNENTGTGSLFGCNKSKFVPVFRLLYPGFGSQDRILRAILWMSWTLWTKWTRKSIPLRVKSTGSTMSISSMVWSKEPRSTADFRIIGLDFYPFNKCKMGTWHRG